MSESLAEIMDQLREEMDLESVDEEIVSAMGLFAWHMQQSGEEWLKYAKDLLSAIVSFKEKRHRMLYGEKVAITYAEAEAFVITVINVIDKEVADPELKERIYKGIGVPDAVLARAGIGTPGAG